MAPNPPQSHIGLIGHCASENSDPKGGLALYRKKTAFLIPTKQRHLHSCENVMKESSERPSRWRLWPGIMGNAMLVVLSLAAVTLLCEAVLRLAYPLVADYHMEMWRYSAEMKVPLFDAKLPFHHFPN